MYMLRITEDGLVDVSDVAGEADLALLARLMQPDLDGGGAQEMAHIGQADGDAVVDLHDFVVGAGDHVGHEPVHILELVQRFDHRLAGALGLAGFPVSLLHLDVGRVAQHNAAQLHRGGAGVDVAAEALLP